MLDVSGPSWPESGSVHHGSLRHQKAAFATDSLVGVVSHLTCSALKCAAREVCIQVRALCTNSSSRVETRRKLRVPKLVPFPRTTNRVYLVESADNRQCLDTQRAADGSWTLRCTLRRACLHRSMDVQDFLCEVKTSACIYPPHQLSWLRW